MSQFFRQNISDLKNTSAPLIEFQTMRLFFCLYNLLEQKLDLAQLAEPIWNFLDAAPMYLVVNCCKSLVEGLINFDRHQTWLVGDWPENEAMLRHERDWSEATLGFLQV